MRQLDDVCKILLNLEALKFVIPIPLPLPLMFICYYYYYLLLFLGAATGSPYIVFILTSGMLRSSDIYIYIYIICVPTRNRNNEFIL